MKALKYCLGILYNVIPQRPFTNIGYWLLCVNFVCFKVVWLPINPILGQKSTNIGLFVNRNKPPIYSYVWYVLAQEFQTVFMRTWEPDGVPRETKANRERDYLNTVNFLSLELYLFIMNSRFCLTSSTA